MFGKTSVMVKAAVFYCAELFNLFVLNLLNFCVAFLSKISSIEQASGIYPRF